MLETRLRRQEKVVPKTENADRHLLFNDRAPWIVYILDLNPSSAFHTFPEPIRASMQYDYDSL